MNRESVNPVLMAGIRFMSVRPIARFIAVLICVANSELNGDEFGTAI